MIEVVDCGFDRNRQNGELLRLAEAKVDAVISIPVGNASVATGHQAIARAGKKLVLIDSAPSGMSQGDDYVAVVSSDNSEPRRDRRQAAFPVSSGRRRRRNSHLQRRLLRHQRARNRLSQVDRSASARRNDRARAVRPCRGGEARVRATARRERRSRRPCSPPGTFRRSARSRPCARPRGQWP